MKTYYFQAEFPPSEYRIYHSIKEKYITKVHRCGVFKEPEMVDNRWAGLETKFFWPEGTEAEAEDVFKALGHIYDDGSNVFKFAKSPKDVMEDIKSYLGTGYLAVHEDKNMIGAWELKGLWPVTVDFGELCFSSSADVEVNIKWRFLSAEFASKEQIEHDFRWGMWRNDAGKIVSLVQGDLPIGSSCCNLDYFYNSQFVQHEKHKIDIASDETEFVYLCEHVPILAGSMTGTIHVGQDVQSFTFSADDKINGPTCLNLEKSKLNNQTGELTLSFKNPPGLHNIVIDYEYNLHSDAAAS